MLNDIIKFIQLTIIHFFETSKTIVFDNFFNYTFEYLCLCLPYVKKKRQFRNLNYIVDKPYHHQNYSFVKTHGWYDVGVYSKYGPIYILEEDNKIYSL